MKAIAGQTWVSKTRKNKWGQPHAVVIVNPLTPIGGRSPIGLGKVVVQSTTTGRRYEMEYRHLFYRFELEV